MTAVYTPPGDDVFLFDEDEGEEEIVTVGLFDEAALLSFEQQNIPVVVWAGQRSRGKA